MEYPHWQLHRGYWQEGLRENTLQAFSEANKLGCEMVELDVQISRDGVPHVFHDLDLKRFFHIDQSIKRTPSDDLSGLNIPTLKEVLINNQVPKSLNIEIKSIDLFCLSISKKVCQCLAEFGKNKQVLISSFNPMVLYWCSRFLPDTPRALIVHDSHRLMAKSFVWSMKLSNPQYINAHYALIDQEGTRERLLSFGKKLMVWTVNDYDKARFYLKRGASSIISDLPPKSN